MASFLYRVGHFSYTRRWVVLITWLVVLLAVGGAALASGMKMTEDIAIPGTESANAQQILEERFGDAASGVGSGTGGSAGAGSEADQPATARVIVAAPEGTSLTGDGGLAPVLDALEGVTSAADVASISDPATTGTISPDGGAVYFDVQFTVPADDVPAATLGALTSAQTALEADGFTVALSGGPFTEPLELISATEGAGVVLALLVLLVTFGSLLAAGMPILTALLGVGIGLAGVLSFSSVVTISSATLTLALMLGLAVGIDYALFLLSRHRQQLAEGVDPAESAGRAVGTAGSAIVFAGLTVVVALSGLAVTGIPFLGTMGFAAAATVAVAVLIAVTLLPALMGFAGTRLIPRGRAAARAQRSAKAENRWGTLITRHPVWTLVTGVLVLGAVALPATSMRLGLPDAGQEPVTSNERQAYDLLAENFGPGINGPLVVLVDAADDPAALADATARVTEALGGVANVAYVAPAAPNGAVNGMLGPDQPAPEGTPEADAALILVLPTTGPNDVETADVVHDIRALRADIEEATGTHIWVTGAAAANIDITQKLSDALPLFLAIVVGLAFILLLVAFRSILVPVTAVLGFLLTVAAAFGATTAVYQWGWLSDVFRVAAPAPLLSFMPVLLVGVLFGLAMDYQVFLVSRMREDHVHGAAPLAAVRSGYSHGARVVLAAALIMISVFSSFVFSGNSTIGPIAFAMGFGVAVDALVVRMTMIPAVMALLGKSAWWLPRWLDRLVPNVDIEGAALERGATTHVAEPEAEPARR
ncbi:putative drug exporter of the RND superfamily [Sanguibacter gelidistatuariae]|uniref:Putative drug exporter of the RND superfamily n=1 Tax=Sanguibacter gelidistatuariae TaxID=1814289 RepID=A0A1G6V531_9MICO|nr:MMPL family transporter [Sanguibacter gelidistatuariae]SDD48117.1 putative drug exporter of the RND superfamily [Sanguibacter gelidistatuariae]